MSELQIQSVLQQMRSVAQSGGIEGVAQHAADPEVPRFAELLKDAVHGVRDLQNDAADLQDRFERGDPEVNISEVMLAMNKSSVGFEALSQVRSRLLRAYQEVMRMQV